MSEHEVSIRSLREDLADERERMIWGLVETRDDEALIAKLAAYQGVIAAIDAHLTERLIRRDGPVRYSPGEKA